jgi:quercetin 2,3-dioxygenase
MSRRKCSFIARGQKTVDGAGVHLSRFLDLNTVEDFDPFLLLDGFDSSDPDDYIKGFPWHPHRGIETVTYLLHGKIVHGDSLGNSGAIRDNQCQWMTTGSGIIHQEMPQASEHLLGCQLWINLPKNEKMTGPVYRDIDKNDIPLVEEERSVVRILSGKYRNKTGPLKDDYVKVQYLDVTLEPDTAWSYHDTPNCQTLFIYLIDGSLSIDENFSGYETKSCAILMSSSSDEESVYDEVLVKSGPEGARFLLIAGKPLREPIAWGGPIVMNTDDELNEAFEELDNGKFIKHGKHENK